ncbi:MAG: 3-isopropylmalate dehydratase small subunit [Terriglobales bacterium]
MQPFTQHEGLVVPLLRANIDTDQIIPKQFLKRTERTGYGDFLFYDWRCGANGTPTSDFILNQPSMKAGSILLAGKNFGCGSSREHAAWALLDYGFRVVIAPSFGDIFAINAEKNGILTVTLPDLEIAYLGDMATQKNGYCLVVDLETCVIRDACGWKTEFSINDHRRRCLLEGLDEIGATLLLREKITAYERQRPALSVSGNRATF